MKGTTMPITSIKATETWASRPALIVPTSDPRYDIYARASLGGGGCELQATYEGAGIIPTDEIPLATKLLFKWGLSAEEIIASDLMNKGFKPVGEGAQIVYAIEDTDPETGTRILITGTSDGLYEAPGDNEFHVPEDTVMTVEMKTTQSGLFAEMARPSENGLPQGNLLDYSRQAALHSVGCEVDYAGILVFNRNDPKEMRLVTLRPEAVNHYKEQGIGRIRRITRSFRLFTETGELPDFNPDHSVRKGYCNGCPYRSMCHPNGIKMSASKTDAADMDEPATSDLTVDEFADKLRRVAEMKAVQSALNKTVNSETAALKAFVASEGYTELSVPVSITTENGEPLDGETIEYYAGLKTDVMGIVEDAVKKYTAKQTGYAHISVKESPGKPGVPAANVPAVLVNYPELVAIGKNTSRTTVSRKAKPLTQKSIDEQRSE